MVPRSSRRSLTLALVLALSPLPGPAPEGAAQELDAVAPQRMTKERLRSSGFWPRRTFETTDGHAGSAACGECHRAILATQAATPMARTLFAAAPSHLVEVGGAGAGEAGACEAGAAEVELGPFRYRLEPRPEGLALTAGDGERTLSAPVEWVFGAGETGYTYVWRRDGVLYESRFSYFPTLGRFAATPGRLLGPPDSLEMALGHALPGPEARGCFSCHATALADGEAIDPRRLTPGVTCEGCHGPGADHLALEKSGLDGSGAIFDPGRLGPHEIVDFCGACHHTFWDVELSPTTGVATVRSPSYRLVKSRCWGDGDPRLTCLSCHDPHRELEHEAAAYDGACRACHGATGLEGEAGAAGAPGSHAEAGALAQATTDGEPAPPCPVGTERCVACHMAKYELPEVHVESTDHWIRVVRRGAPFPE